MTPNELEQRLKNLKNTFQDLDITPNNFFQLVKPTDELLKPYQNVLQDSKINIHILRISFIPRIMLHMSKSLAVSLIRTNELSSWHRHNVVSKGTLIVSHFTHAQQSLFPDVFFGDLLSRKVNNVFYLNSTRIKHQKLVNFYPAEERQNLIFMTKSLPLLKVISLHVKYFFISLELLKKSFSNKYDLIDKWLLIEAGVRQHSRSTLANKFFEIRLIETIKSLQPLRISFTFEGHSHEAVIIELIHRNFPHIKLHPYQHAPVVPDQFGIIRNLRSLNSNDKVLTSGEITKEFFSAFRQDIVVQIAGSSKFKEHSKILPAQDKIRVIGASEGTIQSLEDFIELFGALATQLPNIDFKLRVHPAINKDELNNLLKCSHFDNSLISRNSLLEDLASATYCIYRSSAVAIEGLAFGITPLYFDKSKSQGLNPLFFANLRLPVFSSSIELAEFFQDLLYLDIAQQGINREELWLISNKYFSKIQEGTTLI